MCSIGLVRHKRWGFIICFVEISFILLSIFNLEFWFLTIKFVTNELAVPFSYIDVVCDLH